MVVFCSEILVFSVFTILWHIFSYSSSEIGEISWFYSLSPQLTRLSFFSSPGNTDSVPDHIVVTFATNKLNPQGSHNSRATFSLFCRPAGTSVPCCHIKCLPCIVLLWNHSFLLWFGFQTTGTVAFCEKTGNKWRNILWLLTLALHWSNAGMWRSSLLSSYTGYKPKTQVTYCILFLTNCLKTAAFKLSEGNAGYICEPTFLGVLGELWIPHLFPGVASADCSLSHKKKGLLGSENSPVKTVQIKVYHEGVGCLCQKKKKKNLLKTLILLKFSLVCFPGTSHYFPSFSQSYLTHSLTILPM